MDAQFKQILKNRPSVLGNSLWVFLVQLFFRVCSIIFLVLGVLLLADIGVIEPLKSKLSILLAGIESPSDEATIALFRVIAIAFILIGILSSIIVRIIRMLLRRNMFIFDIVEWHEELTKPSENKTEPS